MATVRFGVVIPTYRPTGHLLELVRACLLADLVDTVVLSDDASPDRSVVERAVALDPQRVRLVVAERNGGTAEARRRGARATDPSHVCFVDQDDLLLAGHFSRAAQLHAGGAAVVVANGWRLVEGSLVPLYLRDQSALTVRRLRAACWIKSPGQVTMARSAYDDVGGFDAAAPGGADDYDLWLRLFTGGSARAWQPTPTFVWRQHANNASAGIDMIAAEHGVLGANGARRRATTELLVNNPLRASVRAWQRRRRSVDASTLAWGEHGLDVCLREPVARRPSPDRPPAGGTDPG